MTNGLFLALEGGDGAGKSAQVELLAGAIRHSGAAGVEGARDLVVTREPGGSALGGRIRSLLLHGDDVDPATEALLYAADRAAHVTQVIRPALERGAVVLTDRYVDSSVAYQAEGRGLDQADIRSINAFATGGLTPDLTVVLDIDPAVAAQRRVAAGLAEDRLERAGMEFHRRVNGHYARFAAAAPDRYALVDAAGTPDQVAKLVWRAVAPYLGVAP
jgi:dTMP kinase